MAASVIAAVLDRYDTFTVASTATAYFDEAPARDAPYVVVKDDGTEPTPDFKNNPIETTRLRFEVYGTTLTQADAVALGIRFNGGALDGGAGFDRASTLSVTNQTLLSARWLSEQRFQEGGRGPSAGIIFRVRCEYEIRMVRTA